MTESQRDPVPTSVGRDLRKRLLIVIPAWNEEKSVAAVVRDVRLTLPEASIVVVDDGSTDTTRKEARSAGATVLSLPMNLGVGGAMRTGFRYAVRYGYDIVVQIDADGQHDPRQVDRLLATLENGADVAIGARFAGEGTYQVRGPRRWAMRVLARWLSHIVESPLTDVTSGFRAVGGPAVELFARHYPAQYLGDTVEMLVIAKRAGCRIRQVPVAMNERMAGTSSQSPVRATIHLIRAVLAVALASGRRWQGETVSGVLEREGSQ